LGEEKEKARKTGKKILYACYGTGTMPSQPQQPSGTACSVRTGRLAGVFSYNV
jgi:hypothetical protein